MFCGFCGEKLNKSDKFCLNCGEATSQGKPVEAEKPAPVPYSASKDEVIEQKSVEEESDKEPLFGFLRSTRFWKVIGFALVILLVFVPSAIYLTSKPDSENIVAVSATPESTSASPVPSQSKIEPSPEPKSTGTPTPKTSKSPSAKTEAKLCRTIKQFGEEKQCFKLSETTQLTVESRYGDCPVVAASNGTCDIGTIVIVPTDRGAVIKPCSPGGDIKYSVNGNIGGIIGGGEPSSLRNETCLTKSNNTNPYILNYFPPLSFLPNVVSDVRYLLPEIGVEVLDEYIN
jgi:ubiquitin